MDIWWESIPDKEQSKCNTEALRAGSPGEGGVSGGQGPQATVVLGRDQSTPARPGWQGLQAPWVGKQQRLGPTGV